MRWGGSSASAFLIIVIFYLFKLGAWQVRWTSRTQREKEAGEKDKLLPRKKEADSITVPALPKNAAQFSAWKEAVRNKVVAASGRSREAFLWMLDVEEVSVSYETDTSSTSSIHRNASRLRPDAATTLLLTASFQAENCAAFFGNAGTVMESASFLRGGSFSFFSFFLLSLRPRRPSDRRSEERRVGKECRL